MALTDIVELQSVPNRPHIVVGCSCTGALAVWDTWTRQLLVSVVHNCTGIGIVEHWEAAKLCSCVRALAVQGTWIHCSSW
jgi:hypothetical protein